MRQSFFPPFKKNKIKTRLKRERSRQPNRARTSFSPFFYLFRIQPAPSFLFQPKQVNFCRYMFLLGQHGLRRKINQDQSRAMEGGEAHMAGFLNGEALRPNRSCSTERLHNGVPRVHVPSVPSLVGTQLVQEAWWRCVWEMWGNLLIPYNGLAPVVWVCTELEVMDSALIPLVVLTEGKPCYTP